MENLMYKSNKIADCGRIIYRFMSAREITNYLGINNNTKEKRREIIKEFKTFEEKYKNQNVDFAMNSDLKNNNIYNYKILNSGKFISAFTL